MNIENKNLNFIDLFLYLSILLFLGRATFFPYLSVFISACILGLLIFIFQIAHYKLSVYLAIFLACSLFITILLLVNNGLDSGLTFLPHTLAAIGMAWRIHTHGINPRFVKICFYLLIFNFFIFVLILNYNPEDIYMNSRNHISAMFINLITLLYISYRINNIHITIFPFILILAASLISIGAAGIFVSLGIFFSYLLFRYTSILTKKLFLTFIVFIGFIFLLIYLWPYLTNYISNNYSFQSDINIKYNREFLSIITSNPRMEIYQEYINYLDIKYFLFGLPLDIEFKGFANLHSSLLVLHSKAGIMIIPIILLIFNSIYRLFKVDFLLFIFIISIILRSLTDTILFSGYHYEYVFMYLVFFAGKEKNDFKANSIEVKYDKDEYK